MNFCWIYYSVYQFTVSANKVTDFHHLNLHHIFQILIYISFIHLDLSKILLHCENPDTRSTRSKILLSNRPIWKTLFPLQLWHCTSKANPPFACTILPPPAQVSSYIYAIYTSASRLAGSTFGLHNTRCLAVWPRRATSRKTQDVYTHIHTATKGFLSRRDTSPAGRRQERQERNL